MRFLLLLSLLCSSWLATAQSIYNRKKQAIPSEATLVYKKESQFGIMVHSNGYGLGYKRGVQSPFSGYRKLTIVADFVYMKHPKELRSKNQFYDNAKSFVFGKQNAFMIFRLGLGQDNLLFDRAKKDGVEIGYNYEAGLSLGLLKPVYLDVLVEDKELKTYVIATERYDKDRHPSELIYGGAGFFTGFGQIKPLPGGYLKGSMYFDWAKEETKILRLETGIVLDVFPKKVPIFADFGRDVNKWYFATFFAKVSFGKKQL